MMSTNQDDDNSRKHPRCDEGEEVVNHHLLRGDQKEKQESSQKRMKVDNNTTSATSAQTLLTSAEEEGSVVKNKHAISIKRSGKKKMLHLWIWIRESPKWWLLMIQNGWASQLMRILTAAQRYAEDNNFQLVVHGVVYAEQVSRREVLESTAFGKLLNDLMDFQLDVELGHYTDFNSGDKLWVMCTEYLRFGEDPAKVKWMLERIEEIGVNGVNVDVVTLKEFDLDREPCLEAWKELTDNLGTLAENASHTKTGKQVEIDSKKKKEREEVEREAEKIEEHLRKHNCLPPESTQQNIKFYRPKAADVEKLTKTFIEAQKEIGKCDVLNHQEVKDAVSLIEGAVSGNVQLLKSSTGGLDTAFYFRSSHGKSVDKVSIELEDGGGKSDAPLQQFAYNMAMLRQLVQRQDEEIRVIVFYDDQKSRDSRCNPEFASFLHGVLSQQFSIGIISQWNRISTHLAAFDLLQELCSTREVSLLFPKEIGQDQREIAFTESTRRDLQRQIVESFNERMDGRRNGISNEYFTIGQKNYTKEEKNEFIENLEGYGLNEDFMNELKETAKKLRSFDADLSE